MNETFNEFIEDCKKSVELDPWVKERKIKGYAEELKDEVEEINEAIEKNDDSNLKEELGDVLMDWCHLCMLAEKEEKFTVKDVIKSASDKLKRRKPYILDNRKVSKEEARAIWQRVKQEEKSK